MHVHNEMFDIDISKNVYCAIFHRNSNCPHYVLSFKIALNITHSGHAKDLDNFCTFLAHVHGDLKTINIIIRYNRL